MSRRKTSLSAFALAVVSVSLLASAAPVHYDEGTSGDLPADLPIPTFTFDVGVNTITGSTTYLVNDPVSGRIDRDSFAVVVPNGLSIVSGTYVVSENDANQTLVQDGYQVFDNLTFTYPAIHEFEADPPLSGAIPALSAGSYGFYNGFYGLRGTAPFTANYTLTFIVVPEPASLALCALTGLTMVRRRH